MFSNSEFHNEGKTIPHNNKTFILFLCLWKQHDWEVAVKCINKKNLAKSQTLLGKEIRILKVKVNNLIVASSVHSMLMVTCVFPAGVETRQHCCSPGFSGTSQWAGVLNQLPAQVLLHHHFMFHLSCFVASN